jgi:hypothetical protein
MNQGKIISVGIILPSQSMFRLTVDTNESIAAVKHLCVLELGNVNQSKLALLHES